MLFAIVLISAFNGAYTVMMKYMQKKHIKNQRDRIFYNFLLCIFQIVFLLALPPYNKISFGSTTIILGVSFSILNLIFTMMYLKALSEGPLSTTALIISLDLIIPIAFTIIAWHEKITPIIFIGLLIMVCSLFLVNSNSYYENDKKKKIEFKWIISVIITFIAGGSSQVITRYNGMLCPAHGKEYLIVYNISIAIITSVYLAFCKNKDGKNDNENDVSENKNTADKSITRRFIIDTAFAALLLMIQNTFLVNFVAKFKAAFFYPATKTGGLVFIYLFSMFFFKEKMSKKATIGLIIGLAALFLLKM